LQCELVPGCAEVRTRGVLAMMRYADPCLLYLSLVQEDGINIGGLFIMKAIWASGVRHSNIYPRRAFA